MEVNTDKLESYRRKHYLTTKEFADKLGMTRQAYYDILESKSTKLSTITRIAETLGCKAKELLK